MLSPLLPRTLRFYDRELQLPLGWIDAIQDNRRLPILGADRATNCPGTRDSVQVEVESAPLTLQIGGVRADRVNIAILRLWPFEWKW